MGYWLKLYTDILDDPKYFRLSEPAKLGMYELLLVAKKIENGELTGKLPTIEDIAFHTRKTVEEWESILPELLTIGMVIDDGDLTIKNYIKRQDAIPDAERIKQFRKKRNDSVMQGETEMKRDCNGIATNRNGEKIREDKKRKDKETDVDVDESQSNTPNFYSKFSETLCIPLMGGKDLQYLADLQKEHGDEKILEIAKWLKNKDPDGSNMWKALRAIDTAAKNWKDIQKTNSKLFEEWIHGDKRIGGKTIGEIEQTSPAIQADTGNA